MRPEDDDYTRLALGDYDDDGYADVLISDRGLWRNLGGSGRFKRVDQELGLDIKGRSAVFADFNNDGHLDLSITNCYRVWMNPFYEGAGDGFFLDVTFRTGAFAFSACGQAAADFDNDGEHDLFVTALLFFCPLIQYNNGEFHGYRPANRKPDKSLCTRFHS
ncbi:MAG: VCBS repeat-containing protein [Candidatus Aminicenantales bacterium]